VFEKFRKAAMSLVVSMTLFVLNSTNCAQETIQLPLAECSLTFMLEDFLEIYHENSGVIEIRQ